MTALMTSISPAFAWVVFWFALAFVVVTTIEWLLAWRKHRLQVRVHAPGLRGRHYT